MTQWKTIVPIFDFNCPDCTFSFEEVYFPKETIEDHKPCPRCGCKAKRKKFGAFAIVGPIFEGMEKYESALLSTAQRKAGARFTSGRDIERWEQEQGFNRVDHNSTAYRAYREQGVEESREMDRITRKEGVGATADWIEKKEIMDVTSMDSTQYSKWKELSDAATHNAPDTT